MCRQPQYRLAIAAALPRLKLLDGQPVSPGEALQYLAALQLQAFQPAPALPPPPAPGQLQGQALGEQAPQQAQRPAVAAAAGRLCDSGQQESGQQTAAPPAEGQELQGAGPSAPVPLQRIQRMIAAFAGRPAPDNCLQPHGAPPSSQQQQAHQGEAEMSSAGGPEHELLELLHSCPQLAGAIRKALQQVDAPASPAKSHHHHQHGHAACSGQPQPEEDAQRQLERLPAVLHTSTAAQTEPDVDATKQQEECQQQLAALQDEAQALQAELEVQALATQRAQQHAAASAQQAQQQAAEFARLADVQVAEARQQAAGALDQARGELGSLQARHEALEAQLSEAHSSAAQGRRRQQDLEYELARAWQELDGSEAARQAEQQRAVAEAERLAAELAHGRAEVAAVRGELAAARQEVAQQRQVAERLQAEVAAAGAEGSRRQEQLEQELAAAQAQLADRQQQAQEAARREQEAAQQLRQLSSTLAAVHEEHDAALAALRQQHQRELAAAAADSRAAAAAAQAERDEVQRRLAATEAEFRCALQVGGRGLLLRSCSRCSWPVRDTGLCRILACAVSAGLREGSLLPWSHACRRALVQQRPWGPGGVQEAAREAQHMRQDLEALAAECVELRRALRDTQARRQVGCYRWRAASVLRRGIDAAAAGSSQPGAVAPASARSTGVPLASWLLPPLANVRLLTSLACRRTPRAWRASSARWCSSRSCACEAWRRRRQRRVPGCRR